MAINLKYYKEKRLIFNFYISSSIKIEENQGPRVILSVIPSYMHGALVT